MDTELIEIQKRALGLDKDKFVVADGTVKSVDWNNRNCVVTTNDFGDIPNVRLRGAADGNVYGWVNKPTVNSAVIIAFVYNQPANAIVTGFTQLDAISLCDGNGNELFSIDLTSNPAKFVFNGGNNNGIIKLLQALNDINTIQKDLNTLKTAMQTLLNVVVDEPGNGAPSAFQTAMKGALANWDSAQITLSTQNDWEDTNVKH